MKPDEDKKQKCIMPRCNNNKTLKQEICQTCIDKENKLPPKERERREKEALEIFGDMTF